MALHRNLPFAALLLAGAIAGCSSQKKDPTANAKVSVDAASIADVGSIKLTISAADMSTITTQLTKGPSGNVWTGHVSNIPATPAGSSRLFRAEAFDASATPVMIYAGETTATVIAGQTAQVTIRLQELNVPPGPTNYAPLITSITSTNAYVLPGQTGELGVTATDPDCSVSPTEEGCGNPLLYQWTASCSAGTLGLGTPTAAVTTFTAPAVNSLCTVTIKVTESSVAANHQSPLSVATSFTITVNANFGDAEIFGFPNSSPLVSVRGDFRYNYFADVTTMPVGQEGDLFTTAIDPDGDNVRFDLSARCGPDAASLAAIGAQFFSLVTSTTTAGGTVSPPTSTPAFQFNPTFGHGTYVAGGLDVARYTTAGHDCEFRIDVHDLCTAGNCGATSTQGALPNGADKGSVTTGYVNATHPAQPLRAPRIVRYGVPNQLPTAPDAGGVQTWDPKKVVIVDPSVTYNLMAEATDEYQAGPLSVAWACVNDNGPVGTLGTPVNTAATQKDLKSEITWQTPSALSVGMRCTATFTSQASGLSTVVTARFAGTDPCITLGQGAICDDGSVCTGVGPTETATCSAGLVCGGGNQVLTCSVTDAQCQTASCHPINGCQVTNLPDAVTSCSDGSGCTTGDSCSAGACTAGPAVTCASPPNAYCYDAAGSCQSLTASSFQCNYTATTAACTAANAADKCFNTFACDGAGACVGVLADPKNCATGECVSGATCQPSTGACLGGTNVADGTPCTADANLCTNESCQGGACTPVAKCAAGEACDPAAGVCLASVPVNKIAKVLEVNRFDGVAANAAGDAHFVAATAVFSPAKSVDGVSVAGAGGRDLFLSRYNPTTGAPVWSVAIGDDLNQDGTDLAVTADGTVAVIGRVGAGARLGACTSTPQTPPLPPVIACSGVVVTNAATIETDFLLLADPANGAVRTGTLAINNGSGALKSVATHPARNEIAVCGYAGAISSIAPLGTTYGGGLKDALVAVFNSDGTLKWARQFGDTTPSNAANEECDAIALAADGSVYAAGKYNGALDLGTGAFPTLGSVSNVQHLWVARFAAADGVTLASAAFGTTAPAPVGNDTPNDLEIDSAGDVLVAGSFTASFPVGSLVATGTTTDAMVFKLTGALAPVWGVRLGNTGADSANTLALTSFNDVVVGGHHTGVANGSASSGAAALVAPGTQANAFVLKLAGNTGATQFAATYGDTAIQQVNRLALRGTRFQLGGVITGAMDFGNPVPFTPASLPISSTVQQTYTVLGDLQ